MTADDDRLSPLLKTGRSFYPWVAALTLVFLLGVYGYISQLDLGLSQTGMNDITIWALYIVNFIFFSGISLAGIGIAAAVRIMHLKTYEPIVRFAELLTVLSLAMAGLSVVIDLGRPDRSSFLVQYYFERLGTSTMIWDITAVATYLILSLAFLYMGMRSDINYYKEKCTGWKRSIYGLLLPLYNDDEKPTVKRIARLLSITILPVMVMFHTVLAWIFGVGSQRSLWFGAVAGPYFVSAALASGIAAITLIMALVRGLFHWEDRLPKEIFRGLGNFLAVGILVYLYFMLSEMITARYAGPTGDFLVSQEWLVGDFAWIFWPMLIIGMIIPFITLVAQAIRPAHVNIGVTAFVSALVVAAFWLKRFIIIVPTLSLGAPVPYTPSWVETSITLAEFALFALLYTGFVKLFPMFEMEEQADD